MSKPPIRREPDPMMGSKAFESPLISHARMRGLYRALVESRVLGRKGGWPKHFEACWVATALDLRDGDLTSDAQAAWLTNYVRALGAREAARAATMAEVKKARTSAVNAKASAFPGSASDRMFCAVGQAMALKSTGQGVVIAYVAANELKLPQWKHIIAASQDGALPLIIVSTPAQPAPVLDRFNIPVIPVDAGDAIAIYRVAQESIVRARADGRMAIIQCVPCGVDPVKMMAAQLVKKGICTPRWVASVEQTFRPIAARA